MTARRSDTDLPAWMGKYPRKGADWSPEEDQALMHAYESGRYLTRDIAACHMRETVAIEWRIEVLRQQAFRPRRIEVLRQQARKQQYRKRLKREAEMAEAGRLMKTWQQEQETAREAIAKFRRQFPRCCWSKEELEAREAFRPRQQGKSWMRDVLRSKFKVGDVYTGGIVESIYNHGGMFMISWIPLTDLPPEVAQALQFGQGEAHAND